MLGKSAKSFFRFSINIREFKHDVYGRRQTAKMTSEFVSFSSNP